MNIERTAYFSITTQNRLGIVATINAELLERDVSLRTLWAIVRQGNIAEIVIIPESPAKFKEATKSLDWNIDEGGCFFISGEDTAGALVTVLRQLADEQLDVVAIDAVAIDGKFACYLLASDEHFSAIAEVLGARTPMV